MNKPKPKRPDSVEDKHLEYLDGLRAGGSINMFGASAPLAEAFTITGAEALVILKYWMESFGNKDR